MHIFFTILWIIWMFLTFLYHRKKSAKISTSDLKVSHLTSYFSIKYLDRHVLVAYHVFFLAMLIINCSKRKWKYIPFTKIALSQKLWLKSSSTNYFFINRKCTLYVTFVRICSCPFLRNFIASCILQSAILHAT